MSKEIEEIAAGAELNALMAEKVMGWTRQPDYNYWMTFQGDTFNLHGHIATWSPSALIADAWQVVERVYAIMRSGKMTGKTFYLNCSEPNEHNPDRWCASFEEDEAEGETCEATADTAPLAICRAALLYCAALVVTQEERG